MAIPFLRQLTAVSRTPQANRRLAYFLTFIAGAVNAGGFLAVQQYKMCIRDSSSTVFIIFEKLFPLYPGQPVFRGEWQVDLDRKSVV